jgi:hypothetical protein
MKTHPVVPQAEARRSLAPWHLGWPLEAADLDGDLDAGHDVAVFEDVTDDGAAGALADEDDRAGLGEVAEAVPEVEGEGLLRGGVLGLAVLAVGEDVDVDDGEFAVDDPVEDELGVVDEERALEVGLGLFRAELGVDRAPERPFAKSGKRV